MMQILRFIFLMALLLPAAAGRQAAEPGRDAAAAVAEIISAPLPGSEARGGPSVVVRQVLSDAGPGGGLAAEVPAGGLFPDIRVRVTSYRHTILSSQAVGQIEKLAVRDGDRFAAGDMLMAVDPAFERIQLDRARAALERQALLYENTRELVELQSKGEFELGLARAEMRQAEAEVRFMEAKLERTRLAAPFGGRVADVFVKEGQYVSEGQPAMEILDDAALELEFIVSSLWLSWFKPGHEFKVTIDETGTAHQAVLERLGGKVDPISKSIKVYARLIDSSPELMEGMSGVALITRPQEGAP